MGIFQIWKTFIMRYHKFTSVITAHDSTADTSFPKPKAQILTSPTNTSISWTLCVHLPSFQVKKDLWKVPAELATSLPHPFSDITYNTKGHEVVCWYMLAMPELRRQRITH